MEEKTKIKSEARVALRNNHLLAWVDDNVKTPKGDKFDWHDHQYLIDLY